MTTESPPPAGSQQLAVGAQVARRRLLGVSGESIVLPDAERLTHLQLRRFAGCPICSLHLRSMVERRDDLVAAGVQEIVVFHSTVEELRAQGSDLPFVLIADADRQLYRELGVERSPRSLLDPRAWTPALRGLFRALRGASAKRQSLPAARPHGGRLGLPADFLIDCDGRVVACKYGAHAYDQWSVDELLSLVHSAARRERLAHVGALP